MTYSLLIPCYRAASYLPRLREQVSALNPQFDEVLLADDASDDDTFEIARSLGFSIIRLEKNMGPGGARNELVKRAKGEWIHFLDADDLIDPAFLRLMAPQAMEFRDVILCSGDWIDENDGSLQKRWSFDYRVMQHDSITTLFNCPVPLLCSLIRRSKFLKIGGFDIRKRCWEDGDLHLRLAAEGSIFHVINEVLSTSIRHSRGASGSHLYCHKCRLEFIEGYIQKKIPIARTALSEELQNLGYLLLGEREIFLSYKAFVMAETCGIPRAFSQNHLFDRLLSCLPISLGHLLSSSVKVFASRLIKRKV